MTAHRGKRSALPSLTDLAADLRDGHALADLAAAWGVNATHLAQRLNRAGWDGRGRPTTEERPKREPVVGFLREDTAWMKSARCAQTDADLFFPDNGLSKRAQAICTDCPVRAECDQHSGNVGATHGVWGAKNAAQRRGERGAA